jgi:flagellar basal body-associated protein FliL
MNKTLKLILIFAVIAAVIYGIWWVYKNKTSEQPEEQQQGEVIELPDDTTESINQALEGINVNEVDDELSDIDEIVDQL